MKYTFKNDFHGTAASTNSKDGSVNERQAKRLASKLCPSAGCQCGGSLVERGNDNPDYDIIFDHVNNEISYRIMS